MNAYVFTASQSLVDEVFAEVKNLKWTNNQVNMISQGFFYNEKMVEWFDECLDQVRKEKYPDVSRIVVTSCWANKNTRYKGHHIHYHPNSVISGIFYLTTHQTGETVFQVQDPWYNFDDSLIWYTGRSYNPGQPRGKLIQDKNKPVAGNLVLFPSSLKHSVRPLNEVGERYTVSFNSFVDGTIGDNQTTKITLNTVRVRELYNSNSANASEK
jgi:uncharacterized protein (TIGR02466 family)